MSSAPYRVSLQPDIKFELPVGDDWKEYRVSGDPDVEVVATLLELEDIITSESPEDEIAEAVVRGRDLLLSLVRERMPEVEEIRIGVSAMLQVFSFIVGDASAAAAVGDLIAGAAEAAIEDDDPEAVAAKQAELDAGGTEDAEPVPLDKRSPSSSSRSGTRKTGRRTGGKTARGASSASTSEKRRAAAG